MRDQCTTLDLVRNRAFAAMLVWSVALVAGQVAWPDWNVVFSPLLLLSWGVFCSANALRCGRLHCRVTGPLCLVGALTVVLMAWGVVRLSGALFNSLFLGGVVLAFALEFALGPYGRGRRGAT